MMRKRRRKVSERRTKSRTRRKETSTGTQAPYPQEKEECALFVSIAIPQRPLRLHTQNTAVCNYACIWPQLLLMLLLMLLKHRCRALRPHLQAKIGAHWRRRWAPLIPRTYYGVECIV